MLFLLAGAAATASAGLPGIAVGAGCAPRPICRPVVFRTFPTWYACPPTAFYSWGPSVIVASSGSSSGFTTVSPMMNYAGGEPIYRVPPPVLPAQPVIIPATSFRWKN